LSLVGQLIGSRSGIVVGVDDSARGGAEEPLGAACSGVPKHFTRVTYAPSKISCISFNEFKLPCSFQNAVTYLATIVSYACKMFMKLSPGTSFMNNIFFHSYHPTLEKNQLQSLTT